MSIFYKNQGFKQASTDKTTVFTCPTDGTVIVKTVVMFVLANITLAFL